MSSSPQLRPPVTPAVSLRPRFSSTCLPRLCWCIGPSDAQSNQNPKHRGDLHQHMESEVVHFAMWHPSQNLLLVRGQAHGISNSGQHSLALQWFNVASTSRFCRPHHVTCLDSAAMSKMFFVVAGSIKKREVVSTLATTSATVQNHDVTSHANCIFYRITAQLWPKATKTWTTVPSTKVHHAMSTAPETMFTKLHHALLQQTLHQSRRQEGENTSHTSMKDRTLFEVTHTDGQHCKNS